MPDNEYLDERIQDHEERLRNIELFIGEMRVLVKYAKLAVGILALELGSSLADMGLI